MAFKQYSAKGSYLKENTMVSAEVNLYRTKDETLPWSGETDSVYSKDFAKLGKEYASALVKQLKKDKIILKRMELAPIADIRDHSAGASYSSGQTNWRRRSDTHKKTSRPTSTEMPQSGHLGLLWWK